MSKGGARLDYKGRKTLTEQQKKELHSTLSDSFIKLDQQFHYLSGMLNHAAKKEKSELVGFYFSKMTETCVSCRTQHARIVVISIRR